jgi:formylglycine-generating enzyme required for sulfatase activity
MPRDQIIKPGEVVSNSIGMKLVGLPPGEFTMGSPKGEKSRHSHEDPPHKVKIAAPFLLGVYEVTQFEYRSVIGKNPSQFGDFEDEDTARFPVESVAWDETIEFCAMLTRTPAEQSAGRVYRLPSEAEWEYACRAGTTSPFHFGASLASSEANFNGWLPYGGVGGSDGIKRGAYLQRPVAVGSYKPNAFGLYDMHGNVYEWCADRYARDYYKESPLENPTGPGEGLYRVCRGGGWRSPASQCRSAERYYDLGDLDPKTGQATRRYPDLGFRVACDLRA